MHDVFVSYSHGDPLGERETPLTIWTSEFIRALGATIRSTDPELRGLDIWFDAHFDRTQHLTDELRHRVKSSGILMVIMTPAYLESLWCRDELDWFEEQIADRKRAAGRIFVIHALPTDRAKWPAFLQDDLGNALVGFPFYDPQSEKPFGWGAEDIIRSGKEFNNPLWTLKTALTRRLRDLRGPAPKEAAAEPGLVHRSGAARRIYLHLRPDPDYAKLREQVGEDLKKDGLLPIPVSQPAAAANGMNDWVIERKRRLRDARHCAALGLVRAGDDESFALDLYEIGVEDRDLIEEEKGVKPPCAVFDSASEALDFDYQGFEINRFDIRAPNWRDEFRAWLDAQTRKPRSA